MKCEMLRYCLYLHKLQSETYSLMYTFTPSLKAVWRSLAVAQYNINQWCSNTILPKVFSHLP